MGKMNRAAVLIVILFVLNPLAKLVAEYATGLGKITSAKMGMPFEIASIEVVPLEGDKVELRVLLGIGGKYVEEKSIFKNTPEGYIAEAQPTGTTATTATGTAMGQQDAHAVGTGVGTGDDYDNYYTENNCATTTPAQKGDGNRDSISIKDNEDNNFVLASKENRQTINDLVDKFVASHMLINGIVGDFKYQVIKLAEGERMDTGLISHLNERNIFIQNSAGFFIEGQVKIVTRGRTVVSIFAVSLYHAYYMDANVGVLNIYSTKESKWTSAFSAEAQIDFNNIPDNVRGTGLALLAFIKYAQNTEGLGKEQVKQEMFFMLNNFGVFLTDEKGVIIDSIFHRAQFRLMDGRVGTFTVTGQIDPNTKKGYNWAMVPGGNFYAGLGGDMVDVKTLLTDAKYKDLALTILNNKTLLVGPVVLEEGKRLLQQGELSGIAGEIKKFLE